jgi:fibro-slime domain-containing protein
VGIEVCNGYEYGECSRPCENRCGQGLETCNGAQWQACDAPTPTVDGSIRDLRFTHPDFQVPFSAGVERGIVAQQLDASGRPVYLGGAGGTRTTTGAANFESWFNDTPGTNLSAPFSLSLEHLDDDEPRIGLQEFEFFPIDGELFGNEGLPHNFHFTVEVEQELTYSGGEVLEFSSDDDLWVFINDRLAVDLGGTHAATEIVTLDLDVEANRLGLTRGGTYAIDLFFAERHTDSSALLIDVPAQMLACPGP